MRSDLLAAGRARNGRRWAVAIALGVSLPTFALLVVPWAFPDLAVRWSLSGSALFPKEDGPPPTPTATMATGHALNPAAGSGLHSGQPLGNQDFNGDLLVPEQRSGTAAPLSITPMVKTRALSLWLADIAREAGRDLVLSPDLRGDLTASESTILGWRSRLEAYARVFGFDFAVSDGLIEVHRLGADAEPNALAANGQWSPPHEEAPPPPPPPPPLPETRVVQLAHAPARETATVVAKSASALDVTATADLSTNAIVLSGTSTAIARVARVVAELDRPRRRILLEAKIIEVLRSARLDLGVEWRLTGTVGGDVRLPPNHGDAGSAALLIATGGASALDARISALEAGGKLRVVSRPSVVMVEGSPATIESVRILRIRLPSQGTVVGTDVVEAPTAGRATEDIPVGVRLEVTPAVRAGSRVLLRIRAKSSSLGAPLPPDDIPEELSRMVDAEVMVASGQTAVLGGLSRDADTHSDAGVPGLRRIPGLGLLFGKDSKIGEEEELVVLVTPRLLD